MDPFLPYLDAGNDKRIPFESKKTGGTAVIFMAWEWLQNIPAHLKKFTE
jgi:hypothetical protein